MGTDTEKKPADSELQTFDDILVRIGHFGKFQKSIGLILVLVSWFVGNQNLCPVFTLNIPKHRCNIAEFGNDTYAVQSPSHQSIINRTIPLTDDGDYSSCYRYVTVSSHNGTRTHRRREKCDSWVYDTTVFERTLTTDLDLVCENKILRSHSNMLLFAGKFVGAIAQGFLSDTLGRRRVLIWTSLGCLAAGIGNALVTSVTSLFIFRFLTGIMTTSSYLAAYVLAIEYMGPSHRSKVSFVSRIAFTVAQILMTPIAYFTKDWQMFQFIIMAPSILTILCLWMVPESSRWLLAKNKKEEAEETMQKAARWNKADLPCDVMSKIHQDQDTTTESPLHLFKDTQLTARWVVLYINWIFIAMVYYGLTLNVSNLGSDIFLNYFLIVLVDILATTATGLVVEKISRKYFHLTVMMISGGACAATFIPALAGADKWIVVALSLIGKMAISSAFFLIYTYTAELFPTKYRAFGLGSSSMMARIGGIASPYVADLNTYVHGQFGQVLPQLVFGAAGIVGALLTLMLPETRNRKMPETIADAKNFTKTVPDSKIPDDPTNKKVQLELTQFSKIGQEHRES